MVKVWGSSETPRFELSDFDTDKYMCIAYRVRDDCTMAAAFMSKTSNPPHYRVLDGSKELFYEHRKDAMAYIETIDNR